MSSGTGKSVSAMAAMRLLWRAHTLVFIQAAVESERNWGKFYQTLLARSLAVFPGGSSTAVAFTRGVSSSSGAFWLATGRSSAPGTSCGSRRKQKSEQRGKRLFIPDFILQRPSSFVPAISLKLAVQYCLRTLRTFMSWRWWFERLLFMKSRGV